MEILESKNIKNGKFLDTCFASHPLERSCRHVGSVRGCSWRSGPFALDLSRGDYRAIQTMLNAGGFNVSTPDGNWGNGSRNAIRAFQELKGFAPTGAPEATLEALGL